MARANDDHDDEAGDERHEHDSPNDAVSHDKCRILNATSGALDANCH